MKKYISIATSLMLAASLAACSNQAEKPEEPAATPETTADTAVEPTESAEPSETAEVTDASEITLMGEVTEPLIVNTDQDVLITLDSVSVNMDQPFIQIDNAASVTLNIKGANNISISGAEVKAIKSAADLKIIGDGELNITSEDTCIKSDLNLYVESGNLNLNCESEGDGLRADESLVIYGGTFNINAGECLEATVVQIDGGEFNLSSVDDAINASEKSNLGLSPKFIMNDGHIVINMEAGDTDGVDSNGDIEINGGTIEVNAVSAFDWDGDLVWNGGTILVNGEEVTEVQNSMGEMGAPVNMDHPEGKPFDGERPEGMPEGPDGERPEPPMGEKPADGPRNGN